MLNMPNGILFSHRHMFVNVNQEEGTAYVGVAEPYIEEMPEFSAIELPRVDDELELDHECVDIHLCNGVLKHFQAPLSGRVIEVNDDLEDNPELLHIDPYKNWIFRMEYDEEGELELLLKPKRYMLYLDQLDG